MVYSRWHSWEIVYAIVITQCYVLYPLGCRYSVTFLMVLRVYCLSHRKQSYNVYVPSTMSPLWMIEKVYCRWSVPWVPLTLHPMYHSSILHCKCHRGDSRLHSAITVPCAVSPGWQLWYHPCVWHIGCTVFGTQRAQSMNLLLLSGMHCLV